MEIVDRFRYCPECASENIQKVSDSDNFVQCHNCDFRLFINAGTTGSALIVNDEGKVLMVQRGRDPQKGKYDFPGGFSNFYETGEESARREVKEELGIELQNMEYLCAVPNRYEYDGMTYHVIDIFYTATTQDTPQPLEEEVGEIAWVDLNTADSEMFAFDSVHSAVEAFKKR